MSQRHKVRAAYLGGIPVLVATLARRAEALRDLLKLRQITELRAEGWGLELPSVFDRDFYRKLNR